MTDKELLLLAAKAAGITGDYWGPLHDDGDALRLAVKWHIVVVSIAKTHESEGFSAAYMYHAPIHSAVPHGDNPNAATRRAIVMTAAKIGEFL